MPETLKPGATSVRGRSIRARRQQVHKITENKLELMITVVNRTKSELFADIIQSFDVNMQFIALGEGTADAKMLNLLGLASSEKAIIFSVIRSDKASAALKKIEKTFNTVKNAKGIAYTVPMSSVIGVSVFGFLSNNRMTVKEDK